MMVEESATGTIVPSRMNGTRCDRAGSPKRATRAGLRQPALRRLSALPERKRATLTPQASVKRITMP
eukprot:196688-Alexandrium_andersonii.AAC.1